MIRLLLVTASDIGKGIEESLATYNFTCTTVARNEAVEQVSGASPALVLVEITDIKPGSSSLEVISALKNEERLPVIALVSPDMLTAIDSEIAVEDFIVTPINPAELDMRVRRILHRTEKRDDRELIKSGGLIIDLVTCEVTVDGRIIELTFKEYEMLKLLAGNPGRVYTRADLLNKVWGYDYFGGDRTVDVHIRRLRSKIESAGHTFVETVRNIGYRFKKNS